MSGGDKMSDNKTKLRDYVLAYKFTAVCAGIAAAAFYLRELKRSLKK